MIPFLPESWFPKKRNIDFHTPDRWWISPRIIHVTEQIKKLCVHNRNNKIKGIIGIWNNNKQCCFPVTDQIQFQFVITHKLPQFRNIKGCESCTTTDQNRFCCLTWNKMSIVFSSKKALFRVKSGVKQLKYWWKRSLLLQPLSYSAIFSSVSMKSERLTSFTSIRLIFSCIVSLAFSL